MKQPKPNNCASCGRARERWAKVRGQKVPSCTACYNRLLRGGDFMRKYAHPVLEHKAALVRAKHMMRMGLSPNEAAAKVGMSRRTLLERLGRLASLEAV